MAESAWRFEGFQSVKEVLAYSVETLWDDEELVLSRRVSNNGGVSRLVSTATSAQPSLETTARLEHAHALREELDAAWAARPVSLERRDGWSALLMEDPGGDVLARIIGEPWELRPFLRVAIGVATALGRFHSRGFVHKNIKPANILVKVDTAEAWLAGFGIASRLPRERRAPEPPEVIAGTLAYMAPEQTGRMNRSIDARSDLYSLGVTLYELLTGTLPFSANDPMEWIHCHIARQPLPPDERVPGIPHAVSAIVMKLLAKTAEDRYQTAAGVAADLQRCLTLWDAEQRIAAFPLGAHDISDQLLISEKLYGRQAEIDTLLTAFDRVVRDGKTDLVLVSGYSGIGKSSVAHELHKALVPPRGLFASGKFDQYKRDIPYATLAQAFQSLVRQLLSKGDAELSRWRAELIDALGVNGALMVHLIPELALVVGEQPAVADLAPHEAQARFQLVFRRFLGVFARAEHPLALFLDDLQWLDKATLDLLEHLATHPEVRHLLLVGAYRDNEVGPAHPLLRTLDLLRQARGSVHEIVLQPLTALDVEQLVVDALRCDPAQAQELVQIVHEKTGGNPFFTIQFLMVLAEEALISFDHAATAWTWDIARIRGKGFTENVVDLMAAKLGRLPKKTRDVLGKLACLGNTSTIDMLRLVLNTSEDEIRSALWAVVRADLLKANADGTFSFLHDRVHEAAYTLVPEPERASMHLQIGRILVERTAPEALEQAIFEVVNHLDRGVTLITSVDERQQVAALNLRAGKRARTSAAYASALTYFVAGRALLASDCWEHQFSLVFDLELHVAECEFLTGELSGAEQRLSALLERATTVVERAAVTHLRQALYTTLNRPDRAIEVGLEFLRHVGISWSAEPSDDDVCRELERMWQLLDGRAIEELFDLPLMSDPGWRATMDVLAGLFAPTVLTQSNLYDLVVLRMTTLSLEQGNCDASCYAYSHINRVLGFRFGNYRSAFGFGQLACDLVQRRGLNGFEARVYSAFGAFGMPWMESLRKSRTLVKRGFDMADANGDLTYAVFGFKNLITNLLVSGEPLPDVQREAEQGLAFARKAQFGFAVEWFGVQLMLIKALRGFSLELGAADNAGYGDNAYEQQIAREPPLALCSCSYWIHKLQACVLAQDVGAALEAAEQAQAILWSTRSFLEAADFHFYAALTRAACCDTASADQQAQHFGALLSHQRALAVWAENCAETFGCRALLVSAEVARLEGRDLDAMHLYEQAIDSAREHKLIQNEALGNELAGQFYAARELGTIAATYLRSARYCYLRWGADAKVRQLDQRHPQLRGESTPARATATISAPIEHLDLATVVKMSNAVFSEIKLERLIHTLMVMAIEHAGAERGVLMLLSDDHLQVEAEATTAHDTVHVLQQQKEPTASTVPESVLQFVARTQETVVLDDAALPNPFAEDPYIREQHSRSLLCLPLVKQSKLIGVLYLENQLTPHVFTPTRIAVLKLLASQAAISVEHARLYRGMQQMQAYLKAAQSLSRTGSFGWRPASGQIVWSDETYKIMGHERTPNLTIDHIIQRIHPEDANFVQGVLERGTRNGTDLDFEHRLLLPDGTIKHVYIVGSAIAGDEGNVEYVGAIMDITSRKQAEEALRQSQRDLAHIARVMTMGELAASIAHEVNQPLASVVNSSNACLRWLDNEALDKARRSATRAIAEAERASEIIGRIRALARKSPHSKVRVDINDTIHEVIALARSELQRHAITLRTELSENVPTIWADRIELQQVILNLVMNGIEAMDAVLDRPREMVIRTSVQGSADVLIAMQDSGIGIDAANLDKIFDTFYTTKPQGMGMGLAISRSIVENHEGKLWATPNPGRGATFQFTLPAGSSLQQH